MSLLFHIIVYLKNNLPFPMPRCLFTILRLKGVQLIFFLLMLKNKLASNMSRNACGSLLPTLSIQKTEGLVHILCGPFFYVPKSVSNSSATAGFTDDYPFFLAHLMTFYFSSPSRSTSSLNAFLCGIFISFLLTF